MTLHRRAHWLTCETNTCLQETSKPLKQTSLFCLRSDTVTRNIKYAGFRYKVIAARVQMQIGQCTSRENFQSLHGVFLDEYMSVFIQQGSKIFGPCSHFPLLGRHPPDRTRIGAKLNGAPEKTTLHEV